jgi:SsrA-binding protein
VAEDKKNSNRKVLGTNRKAYHHYSVEETLECGIELAGTEVKSIKTNRFSFTDAYARLIQSELWLVSFHVSPWPFENIHNHDPDRNRRLLVHKDEIKRLKRKVDEKGFTLIPIRVYLKRGLVKIELGICRGKKNYDKRHDIKKRDMKMDAQREMRKRL